MCHFYNATIMEHEILSEGHEVLADMKLIGEIASNLFGTWQAKSSPPTLKKRGLAPH
jgi:hypothetical protein